MGRRQPRARAHPGVPRPHVDAHCGHRILNVWQHDPADVAAGHHTVRRDFGDRFVLGLGIGHPESTAGYRSPLATMRAFLDGLDAAADPVPRGERILAALGPKMLVLARERSLSMHTYFTIPEHTRLAREALGPDALVVPEVAVVVEADDARARAVARDDASTYLGLSNYTNALLRAGLGEDDLAPALRIVIPVATAVAVLASVALRTGARRLMAVVG